MPNTIPDAQPDLASLGRQSADLALRRARACIPARVVTFDAAKATIACQPLIDEPRPDGGHLADPVLQDVPVLYPGSAKASERWPLAPKDTVLVYFLDRAADGWILDLLSAQAADPRSHQPTERRWHDVADAVAVPIATAAGPVTAGCLELRYGGAAAPRLQVTESQLKLGAAATQAILRGTLYRANEDVLLTALVVAIKAALSALGLTGPSSALDVAKAAFDAQKALYLSTVSKTE